MKENQHKKGANRSAAKRGPSPDPVQAPSSPASTPSTSAFTGRAAWACLILIALDLIVYSPVWHHGFVGLDDPSYVTKNPNVTGGLTWHGFLWAFTAGYAANWHPLTWMSHMLDVQVYGLNAGPHHLTSVLLHIANTLLVFGLLHRMTGALGRSAFVAGLFGVHPLHVESVAWVSERKDVLSTFFGMLTIWAYVGYVRQPRWGRHVLLLLLFALGLMAKPMLVTLPFVLLLLDYWPLHRVAWGADRSAWIGLVREKMSLFALVVASSIVTFVAQREAGAVAGLNVFPLDLRVANSLVSWTAYIRDMLWPTSLAAFYPYPRSLPAEQAIESLLILAGVSALVMLAARRHRYAVVGWLWYVGTLLPVIGLVQVGEQSRADRYTYIPLIGLFIIVAWGVPDLLGRWRYRRVALQGAAALAILACTLTARTQVQSWENSVTLWEHALAVTTDNDHAHADLAGVLADQGKLNEAVAHYREALRIRPNVASTRNNLGIVLAVQGRYDEAIREFSEALRLRSDFPEARNNMGSALANQGKFDEAATQFAEVLQRHPDSAQAHSNWGYALARQGNLEEAIAHYTEALRLNPDFVEVHTRLGIALVRQRSFDEAIAHFSKALRIDPGDAEMHNNIGVALALQGKADEAVREFSAALKIKPDFVDARNNLTRAQQAKGEQH